MAKLCNSGATILSFLVVLSCSTTQFAFARQVSSSMGHSMVGHGGAPAPQEAHRPPLECASNMSWHCGSAIIGYIFTGESKPISSECCEQLISIGRDCHDRLTKLDLHLAGSSKKEESVLSNSVKVWNMCSQLQ